MDSSAEFTQCLHSHICPDWKMKAFNRSCEDYGYCGCVTTGTGPGSCGHPGDWMFDRCWKIWQMGYARYCGHVCPGTSSSEMGLYWKLNLWPHGSLWDICHPGEFEGETSAVGSWSGVTLEMVDFVTASTAPGKHVTSGKSWEGVTLETMGVWPQIQGLGWCHPWDCGCDPRFRVWKGVSLWSLRTCDPMWRVWEVGSP